jgi:hypothetical protein
MTHGKEEPMATLLDLLEPAGAAVLRQHTDSVGNVAGDVMVQACTASAAVSLKRMADALEKQNEPVNLCATVEEIANAPDARLARALELNNLLLVLANPNMDLVGDRAGDIAMLAVNKALAPFRGELKAAAGKFD